MKRQYVCFLSFPLFVMTSAAEPAVVRNIVPQEAFELVSQSHDLYHL